ncbi:MAG: SpoIID/LytB domain-containing protein [Pyrinomonadaceae bacterium]
MKLHKLSSLLVLLCLYATLPASAQVDGPAQTQTDQAIEEEWIRLKGEQGDSHSSGARDDLGPVILGNPTQAAVAVRVGIYRNRVPPEGSFSEYWSLHHFFVQVSNTVGDVAVVDRATGSEVAIMQPGNVFDLRFDGTNYIVTGPGVDVAVAGPVFFSPSSPDNLFRVESILRANILGGPNLVPTYRGALEVSRGTSTLAGRVNLVNILELENYVKGVVANESPAFFHVEALKAQATAARGYAVANIGRYMRLGYPFDLVDSSSSQVYRGVLSEHPRTILATEGTRGLVASYNGNIITAFYSSSFGGHSDSVEWIFNSPSASLPGANVTPYLTGIYDGEPPMLDLSDPVVHLNFWSTVQPQVYDMCGRVNNRFSRWRIALSAATIKSRLTGDRYSIVSGNVSGTVTGVQALQRMAGSGRVGVARITLTSGVADVIGWDDLRNVLGRTSASTPSAICGGLNIASNFTLTNPSVLEPYTNIDGSFGGVIATGGGWGHNVGLSQYGAHGRGNAGQDFLQILKAYYTGVDIGSYPIDITRYRGTGPPTLRQQFSAPNAQGTLFVRSTGLKKLVVHINETYDLILDGDTLTSPVVSVDISPYLVQGLNVIQYNPVGRDGGATVNVVVD